MGPFIKIASRKDFARTLQETQGMNKFEYTIMEALSDEQQDCTDIMNYIYFLIRLTNHHNYGPDHDTKTLLLDTFSQYDPEGTGMISVENFEKWLIHQCKMFGFQSENIGDFIDAANIQDDDEINYNDQIRLIVKSLLKLDDMHLKNWFQSTGFRTNHHSHLEFGDILNLTDNRNLYDPEGYGPKLVEIDLNQDGRISFVEASLIGLQIHLRQAEIDNTPCIKSFAGADVDGSGAISEEEFSQWFEASHERMVERGITKKMKRDEIAQEAKKAWKNVDINGDGEVSYEEFIGAIVQRKITNY